MVSISSLEEGYAGDFKDLRIWLAYRSVLPARSAVDRSGGPLLGPLGQVGPDQDVVQYMVYGHHSTIYKMGL
jgi:hypothetical protein